MQFLEGSLHSFHKLNTLLMQTKIWGSRCIFLDFVRKNINRKSRENAGNLEKSRKDKMVEKEEKEEGGRSERRRNNEKEKEERRSEKRRNNEK